MIDREYLEQFFKDLKPLTVENCNINIPQIDEEFHNNVVVSNLIRCGAIPKKDLEIGSTYIGSCRNSSEATWNGNEFEYERTKFGMKYTDTINHFEDDDGFDLFIPIKKK